ncbi:MAG: hypothetical protein [Bacteriophage sp.]|nr:MAG: hypothetical protein [Bacteriophage sp.]
MYHLFLASKAARQCVLYAEKHPEVDQEDLLQTAYRKYQDRCEWDASQWIDEILLGDDPKLIGAFVWSPCKYNWAMIHGETHRHV